MKQIDFPAYPDEERLWGEPFPSTGKDVFINPLFFARLYQRITHLVHFNDGTWSVLNEESSQWVPEDYKTIVKNVQDLVFQVAAECDVRILKKNTLGVSRQIVDQIGHDCYIADYTPDPDTIFAKNGELRWDAARNDFTFREYSDNTLYRQTLTADFVPEAACEEFLRVLNENIPDPEDQRVIQEYTGSALFMQNRTRKFLFLVGNGGTGKSFIVRILQGILPKSRCLELTLNRKDYGISALTNRSLLVVPEAGTKVLCGTFGDFIKKVVGGDAFQSWGIHGHRPTDHTGDFSVIFMSNHEIRLRFDGVGSEWSDRIIPILFTQHIARMDKELIPRLLSNERSGILNWFLAGARRVRQAHWCIDLSPVQKSRLDQIFASHAPVRTFVTQFVEEAAGEYFSSQKALELYNQVRKKCGFPILEEQKFFKLLSNAMADCFGATAVRTLPGANPRGFRNYKLKKTEAERKEGNM